VPECEACGGESGDEEECASCGAVLVETEPPPVPWHFKLLVVATVLYLGWRAVQGVMWVIDRF
jgi:hypothetical protein